MSEPACLPPPGTASGTTHVLRGPDGDVALVWRDFGDGDVTWGVPDGTGGTYLSCRLLEARRYRYLGPLTPPAEVARLRVENERLRAALQKAADQFGFYARSHAAKMPPDLTKATTNSEFAVMCRAALEPPHAE